MFSKFAKITPVTWGVIAALFIFGIVVFAITKDKDTGQLNLWFKGQDVDRIQTAIENCIAARGKDRPTSLLQELSERAMQRTKELNQHRPPPAQERGERL